MYVYVYMQVYWLWPLYPKVLENHHVPHERVVLREVPTLRHTHTNKSKQTHTHKQNRLSP